MNPKDFTYSVSQDGITAILGWLEPDNKFIIVVNTPSSEHYYFPKNNPTFEEAKSITNQTLDCVVRIHKIIKKESNQ